MMSDERASVTVSAYAKVNLYLDVTGRRPDGYHDILSVMQTVSLCDIVTAEKADSISLTCDTAGIPCDERNIAWKCAAAFFESTGIRGGAAIHIEKHIPSQAGLGGGSADGAAVLHCLDRLYGTSMPPEELARIGGTVGADIPFCVMGGCRLCEGTGGVTRTLPETGGYFCIAKGRSGISTAAAYKAIDDLPREEHMTSAELAEQYIGGMMPLYNIFEKVTDNTDVTYLRDCLSAHGGRALMTGSGSAVFGIFTDPDMAAAAAEELDKAGYFAAVCRCTGSYTRKRY